MASDSARGRVELPDDIHTHPAEAAEQILKLLRNPRIPSETIGRISRTAAWMKFERIRAAVVMHPRTPRPLAMSLLSQLRWRDLAHVADAPRLGAPLRSSAEKILLLRLPELALGEKVTLARSSTSSVLRALRSETSPLVVRALLENPRLRLEDALFMVEPDGTPAAVLRAVAEAVRFAGSQELRLTIAAHRGTPPATALRLVQTMDGGTLIRLLALPAVPPLIVMAARRRFESLGVAEPSDGA